jgi:hypothetical protein
MGIETVIAATLAGIGGGVSVTAAGIAFSGFSFGAAAVAFGLGALQSILSPKADAINLGGQFASRNGVTQNIRQPITSRRILYGEARIGGALTFIETTGGDQFLHLVLSMVDHEVQEIGEIWFDDVSIPEDYLDGSGNVVTGTYANQVRIKKYLGTSTQVADADLVAETSADSNFRGRGVAYLYVRLKYDRNVFPSKIPKITAFVKGKKIYDPRDMSTKYSPNAALIVSDYLTTPTDALAPGVGASLSDINETSLIAAANSSEEMVTVANLDDTIESADPSTDIITLTGVNSRLQFQTGDKVNLFDNISSLPGGLAVSTDYYIIAYQRKDTVRIKLASSLANALAGTAVDITSTGEATIRKISEPRYFAGGIVDTNTAPDQNLTSLLSASGGHAVYIGGKWTISVAAFQTPTLTFGESDIISQIVVRSKVSRRDRFNLVKGVYISPLNDGEPSDYPSITNATYVSDDGGVTLPIDLELPMTQRAHTSMRLAKIKLERARQELFFEASFNLSAMQTQPGDVVRINNTRFGWVNKEFEVITWKLDNKELNGVPFFFVKMSLQETDSSVYDWNSGEETAVDPAPNTILPNPLVVNPPTGLSVTPFEIRTAANDLTYEFVISWTPPSDIFVVNGGHYDVQFKPSSASEWLRSFRAEDEDLDITVKQVSPGVAYDARVRSVNEVGVRSAYNSLFGFTIDSPSGATIQIDYRFIDEAVTDSSDYGSIADATDVSLDYGFIGAAPVEAGNFVFQDGNNFVFQDGNNFVFN